MNGENDMNVGESFSAESGDGGQSTSILSDLGGGSGDDGDFSAPKRMSKFSTQTIVIAGVLVVSGVMLFWMRSEAMKAGVEVDWAETPSDYISEKKPTRSQQDQERILAGLTQAEVSVAATEIEKNPFAMEASIPGDNGGVPVDIDFMKAAELAAKKEREHLQAIDREAGKLQLQSVMTGRVPLARISGEMARIGDSIGRFFTVQAIGRSDVELVDDRGEIHVLTMVDEN